MIEKETSSNRMLTDYLYRKAAYNRVPISGTFELSPVCNFNCRMCYVRKTLKEVRESPRKILGLDDWRAIARDAHRAGMLHLLLTGGEPFLWPDFWTLYDELVDMGFLVSINTNGSLIDEKAVAHLKKKPPHKINITLYGAGNETYKRLCGIDGVFSKVDRAICRLIDEGITVKLNCSLTPDNAADLDWIINYAKERKTMLSVATYMFPPVRRDPESIGLNARFTPEEAAAYQLHSILKQQGPERYNSFLRAVLDGYVEPPGLDEGCIDPLDGKVRCRAGKATFWISWDGWMLPCGMMTEPRVDLRENDFLSAWKKLTELTAGLALSGTCDKCPNRHVCHPCAAMALTETGSVSGIPVYLCRVTQHIQNIAKQTLGSVENK